jgi:hypothetical protein
MKNIHIITSDKPGNKSLKPFQRWSISYDPDTGEYDSGKGAWRKK